PSPATASDPASSPAAIVNDTTISFADIEDAVRALVMNDADPYLRDYYTDRDKAIREARQRAVDAKVASMLLAAEAKKRGKTTDELIQSEINEKIAPPTDPEIKAAYDANRSQLAGADLASVRSDLVNFIRNQHSQ